MHHTLETLAEDEMARTHTWEMEMSDEFWTLVEPLVLRVRCD
jgi:hypothetical protein